MLWSDWFRQQNQFVFEISWNVLTVFCDGSLEKMCVYVIWGAYYPPHPKDDWRLCFHRHLFTFAGGGEVPPSSWQGVPHPSWWGIPHPSWWGIPHPSWWGIPILPSGGVPPSFLTGNDTPIPGQDREDTPGHPSSGLDRGTPPVGIGWGYPHQDWLGYPPLGLDGVPPIGTGWGYPLSRDRAAQWALAMRRAVASCVHAGGFSCSIFFFLHLHFLGKIYNQELWNLLSQNGRQTK